MKTLLKQACLWPEKRLTDIAVIDGRLAFPAGAATGTFDETVDLDGRMVVKGFADMHMHLDKALIAHRVANHSGTLGEAIAIMQKYKPGMTDEDIDERAERALLMCYANGTRFVRTHVDVDAGIGLRSLKVLRRLRDRYRGLVAMQIVAFPQEGLANPANLHALKEGLELGADLVGGIPAFDPDPAAHLGRILDLAARHGIGADLHIDETDDPNSLSLELLAEMTVKRGLQGRVFADHCCSLAANPPEVVDRVLGKVAAAGIGIVSLPSTNLYLQGRADEVDVRRGIAPLKRILGHGIKAAVASDNMQDPFNPFGSGNQPLQALVAGHGCHMGGEEDFASLFAMITRHPMDMMGVEFALKEGAPADFIALDAKTPREAIVEQKGVYASFRGGKRENG